MDNLLKIIERAGTDLLQATNISPVWATDDAQPAGNVKLHPVAAS